MCGDAVLSFYAELADSSKIEIKSPLTVVMNADFDVPADDLAFTVPYNNLLAQAKKLFVYDGDKLLFEGLTDEVSNTICGTKAVTAAAARSLAGALLDNEAEPVTYINPSPGFIFSRHLEPFGIKYDDNDETPLCTSLKIEKGMTHWQVLENFCRSKYGAVPRITGDGRALLRKIEHSETVKFGGSDGLPYISLKEMRKPFKLISEVRLKLDNYGGYKGGVKNKNADCSGITRVRYLNAASDNISVATADKMIENGNKNSYCVVLSCPGCCFDVLGKTAVVCDKILGTIDDLRVENVKYTLGIDGETTLVTLRKEKF